MGAEALDVLEVSVGVALTATLLALPVAVLVGFALSRATALTRAVASIPVLMPLVLPPVVTGLALLWLFGRNGPLAALDLDVVFTWRGAVIAAAVMGFPLQVTTARTAFEQVDPAYAHVAAACGRRPLDVFLRVTLPLAYPGVLAAFVLGFARSLGEFGATLVLAGSFAGETRTIATAVYSMLDRPERSPELAVLLVASAALSLLAVIAYEAFVTWQRTRLELDHG